MKFYRKIRPKRILTFFMLFAMSLVFILFGVFARSFQLYERVGGIGIGIIFLLFSAIYLLLHISIGELTVLDRYMTLKTFGGKIQQIPFEIVEMSKNYDGNTYFSYPKEKSNRKGIIDPRNFTSSKELKKLLLEKICGSS